MNSLAIATFTPLTLLLMATYPERSHYDEVILKDRLWSAVQRINPSVPRHALQEAVKDVERIHSPELLANNETFHRHADRRREGQLIKKMGKIAVIWFG